MCGERLMIYWHAALCRPSRATWLSSVDLACQADVPTHHAYTSESMGYCTVHAFCMAIMAPPSWQPGRKLIRLDILNCI